MIRNSMRDVISVDIGGTKIRVGRVSPHFAIRRFIDIPTPKSERAALEAITQTILELAGNDGNPPAIGVAAPARVDRSRGEVGPCTHIPWERKLRVKANLEKRFNCPVVLEHDATAGGITEAHLGNGKNVRYLLYITISTGIGSSLILDGAPLPGPYNPQAGQMALIPNPRPQFGSFEYLASGRAIVREYGKIAAQISSQRTWEQITRPIAQGIYNTIVTTNPEKVVLGGGVSVHFKRFKKPLMKHLTTLAEAYEPSFPLPPITTAKYVETAPLLGAAILAHRATTRH